MERTLRSSQQGYGFEPAQVGYGMRQSCRHRSLILHRFQISCMFLFSKQLQKRDMPVRKLFVIVIHLVLAQKQNVFINVRPDQIVLSNLSGTLIFPLGTRDLLDHSLRWLKTRLFALCDRGHTLYL